MSKRGRGLGQGLDALFSQSGSFQVSDSEPVTEIPIDDIVPNQFQPRREFAEEALAELADSIRQYGILQPVVVRRKLTGFELVAGERRWRAARLAGLNTIPAVVRDYSDGEMTEIALVENLQRQDLNVLEEALAYRRLMEEFGLTQDEVARKLGRSRSHIANTIRLLNLAPAVQEYVSRGTLTMGQVRPLLALVDEEQQVKAADIIIEQQLTAREAEALVKKIKQPPKIKQSSPSATTHLFVREAEDQLKLALGTRVRIKPGKQKSKIEIEFYSQEDLERLLEILTQSQRQVAATAVPQKLTV